MPTDIVLMFVILWLFFLSAVLLGAVIWLVSSSRHAKKRIEETESELDRLKTEFLKMRAAQRTAVAQTPAERSAPPIPIARPEARATPPPAAVAHAQPQPAPAVPWETPAKIPAQPARAALPPRIPIAPAPQPASDAGRPPREPEGINWEKFLGVKLFTWIGGLALFLGMAFFIKYSFDNNLVPPALRIAIGYIVAAGVLVGGLRLSREKNAVTVQTLCATGILILYATTFAAHAYYHFLGAPITFGLMILTTAAAFLLAVRLDAQVVAILGLLGGFMTPPLLSTGVDNPVGLFGYLALLDMGLLAVALRKRWNYLCLLAAVSTAVMQAGWVEKFFAVEKLHVALGIFLGFSILFSATVAVAHRVQRFSAWAVAAAMSMALSAFLFALYLIGNFPEPASKAMLLFGFVFLVDLALLFLVWLRDDLRWVNAFAGGAAFAVLAVWTLNRLTPELLNPALGAYLLFAVLHSAFPVVLQRYRPVGSPLWSINMYPVLALLLIFVPLVGDKAIPFLLWPVVLLVDLLSVVLAVLTASLASLVLVFFLTAALAAAWLLNMPPLQTGLPDVLLVVGGMGVVFLCSVSFVAWKLLAGREAVTGFAAAETAGAPKPSLSPAQFTQLAAMTAALPFLLLILVVQSMNLPVPSPVFGLAALIAVMIFGIVRLFDSDAMAVVSLIGVLALEHTWHLRSFTAEHVATALLWYLSFGILFTVFPFIFLSRFIERLLPWIASAFALPLHFFLIYRGATEALPEFKMMGAVPAVLSLPGMIGLIALIRHVPADHARRNTLLALFGASALFFITFIFPIQFERQWLTVGWALEGAALIWLFQRVPHNGLRLAGCGLLIVSFVRLAFNPWVLIDYQRSGVPVFNWYLYAYGIAIACLMFSARLLAPPKNRVLTANAPAILYTLGTILAFLLLNIEIADFFSGPGDRLVFQFSGNLALDMSYSLAWGVFAFVLLAIGFRRQNAPIRYAGMGLMIVTILKLFLHDLWQLGGMYRIGSLVGLAVVLMVIAFIYQRFLSTPRKETGAQPK